MDAGELHCGKPKPHDEVLQLVWGRELIGNSSAPQMGGPNCSFERSVFVYMHVRERACVSCSESCRNIGVLGKATYLFSKHHSFPMELF